MMGHSDTTRSEEPVDLILLNHVPTREGIEKGTPRSTDDDISSGETWIKRHGGIGSNDIGAQWIDDKYLQARLDA